jgi:undecaprenyl-diphosphatase
MSYFDAVILGLVQGLTEFLPVSSSGHLVMTQAFLGVPQPGIFLEIVLHVATMFSVALVYRQRLAHLLLGGLRREPDALRYIGLLAIATLPVAMVGLFFRRPIEAAFDAPAITGYMLLVTGVILYSTRWTMARSRPSPDAATTAQMATAMADEPTDDLSTAGHGRAAQPTLRHALAMGMIQVLALLPGISRSGSTIAAGLWTGLRGDRAAEFSFLMSLIAIGGAAVLQLSDLEAAGPVDGPLVAAFIAALLAGIAAIKSLVWLIRHQHFHLFAWYVWPVGLVFLAYVYLG